MLEPIHVFWVLVVVLAIVAGWHHARHRAGHHHHHVARSIAGTRRDARSDPVVIEGPKAVDEEDAPRPR